MARNEEIDPVGGAIFLIIVAAMLIWVYGVPIATAWFQANATTIITAVVIVVVIAAVICDALVLLDEGSGAGSLVGAIVFTPLSIALIWIYVVPPVVAWVQANLLLTAVGVIGIVVVGAVAGSKWSALEAERAAEDREIRRQEEEREREETERRLAEEKAFEEEQRAKGLVKYNSFGDRMWGTPEQVEAWKKEEEEQRVKEEEERKGIRKVKDLVAYVERFRPSRWYRDESGFHIELQGYMKSRYPQSAIEVQTGASRPDIVVDDIAIEVKGPTDSKDLVTIADKLLRYSHYYNHIIVVLFEVQVNPTRYDEWTRGLERQYPEKVYVVRIDPQ